MPQSIDERVVSMKFDNRNFQNGVAESLNSINRLKSGLNMQGAVAGFDAIDKSARKINFDGLSSGVDAISLKFSAMQVAGITALANLVNSAVNTGKQLTSALTIQPIFQGYEDYGRKLTSIQTITNATGMTEKQVEPFFNQLDTYADKTIYNLDDMTSAMAKFTNAGVGLDKSVPAIKGIANMVAVAGQDAGAAQIAFYNLSQSIAGGYLTTTDYRSLNLANVATKEWKDNMIKGALAAGTLKKAGNDMYQIKGAKEAVTGASLFNEELSKGWASTSVLMSVLGEYGDETTGIGKKSLAAAQDVKSFGMMMTTLKESVGTGWTDTFHILVGNLAESKALFTPMSNALGGFFSSISKSRNELLEGWKELGGRTSLIEGLSQAFQNVVDIAEAFKKAFRDVFPEVTAKQLYSITEGFKYFANMMHLDGQALYDLRSTFKGFFAILDIGKTILMAAGNAIGIILGSFGGASGGILSVTGAFGKWLYAIDQTIKRTDIFNKVFSGLAYAIRGGLEVIKFAVGGIVEAFKFLYGLAGKYLKFPSLEFLYTILEGLGRRMSSIGDEANGMAFTVGGSFVLMGQYIKSSNIGKLFETIYNTVKTICHAVGNMVGKLADTMSTAIKNANFSSLLDVVGAISIGGMLVAFQKFMKSLKGLSSEGKGIITSIKGAFDGLRGSLESYQKKLKADILMKIAIAVALLAASVVAISLIDSAKLVSSLSAIGALFAQLLVATKVYTMIGNDKTKVLKASAVMISMSTSILILSFAMNNLAKLDWNGIAKGLVGVSALAGVMIATSKLLSKNGKTMLKGATQMIIFAEAIKLLADACVTLSKLDWGQLERGLVGVGVLMAEVTMFLRTAKFSGKMMATATGMVILSLAIKILASACDDFGKMSWGNMIQGLTAMSALLLELSLFTKVNRDAKGMITTGLGVIALAVAMKILASALDDMGKIPFRQMVKGLIAMGGALVIIAGAMHMLPSNTIVIAAGLVVMAGALELIAIALVKMGGMKWLDIKCGLVAMGGALTILAIALNCMNGTLAGSAALLVASVAIGALTISLGLLGAMSWEAIIKSLVALAGAIGVFGLAALVLTPILPSMLGLAASLALLGLSMVGIGAGLALVGVGLSLVTAGLLALAGVTTIAASAIVASLSIIIAGIIALIPMILTKIGEGIVAMVKVFSDSIPTILDSITKIILAIVGCIVTNTPVIIDGVMKILDYLLDTLIKWTPIIAQKVFDIIIEILNVISNNISRFVQAGIDVIIGFIDGISASIGKVIDAAFKLVMAFINGLADSIRNNSQAMADAGYNLVTAIVDGLSACHGRLVDAGVYAVEGFIKGIVSMPGKVVDAAKDIGSTALSSLKNVLGIKSPSREFAQLGVFSGMGFANGLSDYSKKIDQTAGDVGKSAIDTMNEAISSVSTLIDGGIDGAPVIRPVMDLTDIQNGSKQLYSMVDDANNATVNGSISINRSKAQSIADSQSASRVYELDKSTPKPVDDMPTTKAPTVLQLVLSNGRAIAEYIVDDLDSLTGANNNIRGRMVGI